MVVNPANTIHLSHHRNIFVEIFCFFHWAPEMHRCGVQLVKTNWQVIAKPAKPPWPWNPRIRSKTLCSRHNTPSTDDIIGVTSKQGLSITAPCQADTLWLSALLANGLELWLELINLALLLQIKDDDAGRGSGAQPVSVGGENKGMDLITGVQRVQVLRLVQVPQHGGSVLSSWSA